MWPDLWAKSWKKIIILHMLVSVLSYAPPFNISVKSILSRSISAWWSMDGMRIITETNDNFMDYCHGSTVQHPCFAVSSLFILHICSHVKIQILQLCRMECSMMHNTQLYHLGNLKCTLSCKSRDVKMGRSSCAFIYIYNSSCSIKCIFTFIFQF